MNDQKLHRDFEWGEFPLEDRNPWNVWMVHRVLVLIEPARRLHKVDDKIVIREITADLAVNLVAFSVD